MTTKVHRAGGVTAAGQRPHEGFRTDAGLRVSVNQAAARGRWHARGGRSLTRCHRHRPGRLKTDRGAAVSGAFVVGGGRGIPVTDIAMMAGPRQGLQRVPDCSERRSRRRRRPPAPSVRRGHRGDGPAGRPRGQPGKAERSVFTRACRLHRRGLEAARAAGLADWLTATSPKTWPARRRDAGRIRHGTRQQRGPPGPRDGRQPPRIAPPTSAVQRSWPTPSQHLHERLRRRTARPTSRITATSAPRPADPAAPTRARRGNPCFAELPAPPPCSTRSP